MSTSFALAATPSAPRVAYMGGYHGYRASPSIEQFSQDLSSDDYDYALPEPPLYMQAAFSSPAPRAYEAHAVPSSSSSSSLSSLSRPRYAAQPIPLRPRYGSLREADSTSDLAGVIDFAHYRPYDGSSASSETYDAGSALGPEYSTTTTPSSVHSATFTLPKQQPTPVSQQQGRSSTRASTFTCTLCGWLAETSEQYDFHLRAHDGDCLFQCFLGGCEDAFVHPEELLAHAKVHRRPSGHSGSPAKRSWEDEMRPQYVDVAASQTWSPYPHNKRTCYEPATPYTPMSRPGHRKRPSTAEPFVTTDELMGASLTSLGPSGGRHSSVPPDLSSDDRTFGLRGVFAQWEPYASVDSAAAHTRLATPPPPTSPPWVLPTFTIPASPSMSHHAPSRQVQASDTEPMMSPFAYRPLSRRASPINVPFTAPIAQGRFQPYTADVEAQSTDMVFSSSLPHPVGAGRSVRPRVDEPRRPQPVFALPVPEPPSPSPSRVVAFSPQRYSDGSRAYGLPPAASSVEYSAHLQSPVSPVGPLPLVEAYGPASIPVYSGTSPRRRSSASSTGGYSSAQAALVSASSMNRLLSRLPASAHRPPAIAPAYVVTASEPAVSAIHPRFRIPPPASSSTSSGADASSGPDSPQKATKAHMCEIEGCNRAFKRLEHLKRHERTHTAEKPFCCDVEGCGRYFSRSDNLAQHRRTHERNGKNTRKLERQQAAKVAAETAALHGARDDALVERRMSLRGGPLLERYEEERLGF